MVGAAKNSAAGNLETVGKHSILHSCFGQVGVPPLCNIDQVAPPSLRISTETEFLAGSK